MSKNCMRCGKSSWHGGIYLADKSFVCKQCFRDLGFSLMEAIKNAPVTYTWDDIKDGKDAYVTRSVNRLAAEYDADQTKELGLLYSNYGEFNGLNATEDEMLIFDGFREIMADEGMDPQELYVIRESDNYLSACIGINVVAQFKASARSKWVTFPGTHDDKVRVSSPSDVNELADLLIYSAQQALNDL